MSVSLSKIEELLQPAKDRGQSVSFFFGTVIGVNGSTLVIETKSGGTVYAKNYVYCDLGDMVACIAFGTTIIAFAAKDAQRVADDLNKVGLVYNAGDGITIDENNLINADVTEADIQQLSTEIAGKANTTHTHSAADTTSGVFDLERIPTIPASKLSGTIPNDMLPSYVDDVLEYASKSAFPDTGEDGKIYVDESTNKTYRWGGSSYVEISASLALGETENTAYRGDRGKQAYDHISNTENPHNVTIEQIGAAAEYHTHTAAEVGAAATSHTHAISDVTNLQTTLNGKANASHTHSIANVTGLQDVLDDKSDTGHTHSNATTSAAGFLPALGGGTTNFLRADGTWAKPPNTTYGLASTSANGLLRKLDGSTSHYMRGDGTWATPPNTTYGAATTSAAGLMSAADKSKLDGIAAQANKTTVDSALSSTSTNPVQNKAVKTALDAKANSSHTHAASQVTGLTASRALVSDSSGHPAVSAVTSTELSRLDGVTSNVQTQLNGKAATNHAHILNGSSVASPSWYAPRSAGQTGQYLVSSGSGEPVWTDIEGGVVFMPNGYPEGSVYLTYDPDFNPASEFGGTWTKETSTYLFLGITIWRCVSTPNQYFSPLDMHPVGTAFMTYDKAHNPAAEFGGTWTLETSTYMFLGIKIYRRVE